jgi:hypothetical protein
MTKLNYGKRFRSGSVGSGYRYDARLHRGLVPKRFLNVDLITRSWAGIKGSAANAAKNSHCYLGKPVPDDPRLEAEQRLIERIDQCIDVMIFGLEELMMAPPSPQLSRVPQISQQLVIDWVDHMCRMIGRNDHNWGIYRRPGLVQIRRCMECGTELTATEKDRCNGCADTYDTYKHAVLEEARIERLARREKERTIKTMQIILGRIQRRLERRHAKHSRYPDEDAGTMDAGERGENLGLGGEAAHRDSAGDPGHPEGGDDGSPPESDPDPGSANPPPPAGEGDGKSQGS